MEEALWWVILALFLIWFAYRQTPTEDDRNASDEDDHNASDQSLSNTSDRRSPYRRESPGYVGTSEPTPSLDLGQCPACGTNNDPFYRYCRECVTLLR